MSADDHGVLPHPPIHEIVQAMAHSARTGVLHLQRDDVRKCIHFERGRISFAVTSRPDERLGAMAVRARLATWWQVQEAARAIGADKRLGVVMVDLGILSSEERNNLVRGQLREIVVEALGWEDGSFRVAAGEATGGEDLTLDWPVGEALLEHCRRLKDESKLWLGVGGLGARFTRVDDGGLPPPIGMDSAEKRVVAAVDGRRTVEDVIRAAAVPPVLAARTLRLLRMLGGYGVVPAAQVTRPGPGAGRASTTSATAATARVARPAGRYAMAGGAREEAGRPAAPLLSREVREERAALLELIEQLPRMDHYQVLGLRPGSGPGDVEVAFRERAARFHEDRAMHPAFHDLRGALERAHHAVQIAYRTLSDPDARSDYDASRDHEWQARKRATAALDESSRAHLERGSRLMREGRLPDAIPSLQEAVRLRPDLAVAHYRLAQCLATIPGQRAAARDHFQHASRLEPENRRYADALLFVREPAAPPKPTLTRTLQRFLHLTPPDEDR